MNTHEPSEFEKVPQPSVGLASELWAFLRQNKKFWLLPIILILLLFSVLLLLSGTAAAPFIYTLF